MTIIKKAPLFGAFFFLIVHNFFENNWINRCIIDKKGGSLSCKDKEINNYNIMIEKPKLVKGQVWISELDAWVSIEDHLEAIMMNVNESLLEYDNGEEFVNMKNTQACDSKGNHWEEPYLNTRTQKRSEIVVDALNCMGIFAEMDLYEDDDGMGDGGRPIIRQIWSVKLGIKINETYQG